VLTTDKHWNRSSASISAAWKHCLRIFDKADYKNPSIKLPGRGVNGEPSFGIGAFSNGSSLFTAGNVLVICEHSALMSSDSSISGTVKK